MKKINLTSQSMFDDLIDAKYEIDNYMVKHGIIKEKRKIDQFIISLNMQNNIYIDENNTNMLPFTYIDIETEQYFIYSGLEAVANEALELLETCDYNPKNLMHKTNAQILEEELVDQPHFLVTGEFYI